MTFSIHHVGVPVMGTNMNMASIYKSYNKYSKFLFKLVEMAVDTLDNEISNCCYCKPKQYV